jgi:hypothetical protein
VNAIGTIVFAVSITFVLIAEFILFGGGEGRERARWS